MLGMFVPYSQGVPSMRYLENLLYGRARLFNVQVPYEKGCTFLPNKELHTFAEHRKSNLRSLVLGLEFRRVDFGVNTSDVFVVGNYVNERGQNLQPSIWFPALTGRLTKVDALCVELCSFGQFLRVEPFPSKAALRINST
jgi:hypothetical protein